jgi:hypothetical protein
MTFLFKAKNGGMDFGSDYNSARLRQTLKENEGKIFRIEQEVSTRTLSQNKLYWKYLGIISMETGDDINDLHEFFRREFLPPKFIKVMGEERKVPRSTTELKKWEFSDYMDKICARTEIPIPDTEAYLRSIDLAPMK